MAFVNFNVITDSTVIQGLKYYSSAAEEADADDNYKIVTPSGHLLNIDEAGADTAAWLNCSVIFSTSSAEFFSVSLTALATYFPDTSHTEAIYTDYTETTKAAGTEVSFGEGAYGIDYNNDGNVYVVYLHIPTIEDDIDTLATAVINCQCDCEIDSAIAQTYIKARAYLDLIQYKANAATSGADMAEINTMISTLSDFLQGTEELCGSC